MKKRLAKKKIKDLPKDSDLTGVRFKYPGDGKLYHWYSQWQKGVWGKKDMKSGQLTPLFCQDIAEALEWELA